MCAQAGGRAIGIYGVSEATTQCEVRRLETSASSRRPYVFGKSSGDVSCR